MSSKDELVCAVLALSVLTGCASTGVISTGDGAYMIAKQSAGGAFVSGAQVQADLYIEAGAFCSQQGKAVQTIEADAKNAIPFVRTSQASIRFRCVTPTDTPK